jgi:hypothetical protein
MSSSDPKKDADRDGQPAAAEADPLDAAPPGETAPEMKADAKPEADLQAQPAAAVSTDAAADKSSADEPVWPPPESQPSEPPVPTKAGEPPIGEAPPDDQSVLTKPDKSASTDKPAEPAAEPSQEMALSESTLHWLVDAEQPIDASRSNPILAPVYDREAPVAGRKRAVAVIGGAAVLALGIAWALHAQAAHHQSVAAAPTVDSAELLIHRAEAALAQGRSAEALDLAHLAIVTDQRLADAYMVIGAVQRSNGQVNDARESYRRYLELAPIGTHSAEARAALTSLPP